MKAFITNKRLMLSLADAGGRMMYSIKDLSELAGYTSRVYSLVSTLHRVHSHAYSSVHPELYSLADIQGTLHKGFDGVRVEGVPLVAPQVWPYPGEELVQELDFLIRPGAHCLITGPNGAGKSSVARLIAGLWPVYRGLVSRPRKRSNAGAGPDGGLGGVMSLPQRPYLPQGTLRDQVIYPHTAADMKMAGVSDAQLLKILDDVRLAYLPTREGSWDCRKEWKDVLSGGEKQRISLARVLYHQPSFAILDEPTSAVSSDVEGHLYAVAKERAITLITISSRAALKKFHQFQLSLDPTGAWAFERIGGAEERTELVRELDDLRQRAHAAQRMRDRLEAVNHELAQVWVEGGDKLPAPAQAPVSPPRGLGLEESYADVVKEGLGREDGANEERESGSGNESGSGDDGGLEKSYAEVAADLRTSGLTEGSGELLTDESSGAASQPSPEAEAGTGEVAVEG